MRFIHTADWQIGLKAAHVGVVGPRLREVRLETARCVVAEAERNKADFILVAGDIFEDNGVDRLLVQKTADILAESGVPAFVIPGNHDPLVPGSVWDHPGWLEPAGGRKGVHILREPKPVEIPGGFLFPCPIFEKHSGKDPTAWIDSQGAKGIRIGLGHGTVKGVPQEEPDYPIARDAAVRAGLDYLALGHWHSTVVYPDTTGVSRMAYSGTHEATKFGERDSGNVLLVDIAGPGQPPEVSVLKTGRLTWMTLAAELREKGDVTRIRDRVAAIDNPSEVLIEIRFSGLLSGADRDELDRLGEIVTSRFLYSRIDLETLCPLPEDETWLAGLPPGVVREAAFRLLKLADPGFSGRRPEAASPEVAARALMELYLLTRGEGQ